MSDSLIAFQPGDRGAVEHDALGQHVVVDRADVLGGVVPLPARIREPEIDVLTSFSLIRSITFLTFAIGASRLVVFVVRRGQCPYPPSPPKIGGI